MEPTGVDVARWLRHQMREDMMAQLDKTLAYEEQDSFYTVCQDCARDIRMGGGKIKAIAVTPGQRECAYCHCVIDHPTR